MVDKEQHINSKKSKVCITETPELERLILLKETFWINPHYQPRPDFQHMKLSKQDLLEAQERLQRFAPYIATVFPETQDSLGIIESPLLQIPKMQRHLESEYRVKIPGQLWVKCDSHLPISGSIKARGGIYEVLKHAEDLAFAHGVLSKDDQDYTALASEASRQFFSGYSIAVGSTGNLGMSIGIMGAKLGFRVTVHMSKDAKEWKKTLLRKNGVEVIEHMDDYSKAVASGREQAQSDPTCYFIDDENSEYLFIGYAVAALRLQQQIEQQGIRVDEEHPLFVYLPCGVGGAPGGITFGLRLVFGRHVHCFFAEPVHSPSMLLGFVTELYEQVSVQEFGIDNVTDADGLAVGRPSGLVSHMMEHLLTGIYTLQDSELYRLLKALADTEDIFLEPSALAGIPGAIRFVQSDAGKEYLRRHYTNDQLNHATHIAWLTGGSLVPQDVMNDYYAKGVLQKEE